MLFSQNKRDMKKTHTILLGLALTAMAPLAIANSEPPAPEQPPAEQKPADAQKPAAEATPSAEQNPAATTPSQEEQDLAQFTKKAETLTQDQLLDFLSYGAGYAMGSQYLNALEGVKLADFDQALFMKAMSDALKGTPDDEFAKLDVRTYLYAIQNLMSQRSTGKPLTMPEDLPEQDQATFKKLGEEAAKISEPDVLRFMSYFAGYDFAQAFTRDFNALQEGDLRQAPFFEGAQAAMSNQLPEQYNDRAYTMPFMIALEDMFSERIAAAGKANLEAGQAFLAENAKKEGVVTTDSGLQYKVLKISTGEKYDAKKHGEAAKCSVTYEGRLIDGKVFDSSETPIEFPINGVVPGFSEALKLMPVGSEWEIYIPADLGYGEQAPPVIGSNSVLIFKLKLEGLKKEEPRPGTTPGNPIELTPEILEQLQKQGLVPVEGSFEKEEIPAPQPGA